MEIAVLYEGLNLVRVPWADRRTLRLDGVLAISVIQANNPIKTNRFQSSTFHDYYHLIWNNAETECCLTGYDGDYGFFDFTISGQVDWRFPYVMPVNSIEFLGVYVSTEEYKQAKVILSDSRDRMF